MSVDIMELVKGAISKQVMGKIGGMLGTDESKTSTIFDGISAAVIGGLMKKVGMGGGNEAVLDAIEKQDTSVLDQLGDLFGGGQAAEKTEQAGGDLLQSIFGSNTSGLVGTIAKALGIDANLVDKLIKMVTPVVMAVIGKHAKANSLDQSGVANLLNEQKSHLGNYLPGALTSGLGLTSMLGDAQGAVSGVADQVTQSAGKKSNFMTILLIAVLIIVGVGFVFREKVQAFIKEKLEGKKNIPAFVHDPNDTGPRPQAVNAAGGGGPGGGGGQRESNLDVNPETRREAKVDISLLGEKGVELQQNFEDISSAIEELQDEAEATGLAQDISDFTAKIDELDLGSLQAGLPKAAARTLISRFIEKTQEQVSSISDSKLKAVLQPAVDALVKKLEPFAK